MPKSKMGRNVMMMKRSQNKKKKRSTGAESARQVGAWRPSTTTPRANDPRPYVYQYGQDQCEEGVDRSVTAAVWVMADRHVMDSLGHQDPILVIVLIAGDAAI